MNAGAYKYCVSDVFTSAIILNDKGELETLNREQMEFDYRTSILQKHKDWILIEGAQVSPKHSNFIVNNGYASAKDILDLILLVEKSVFNRFGVELEKEVILINWE